MSRSKKPKACALKQAHATLERWDGYPPVAQRRSEAPDAESFDLELELEQLLGRMAHGRVFVVLFLRGRDPKVVSFLLGGLPNYKKGVP